MPVVKPPVAKPVVVPDLGDFTDVEVIEVLVAPGDAVQAETPLITLESDKATMEIPSPGSGEVSELKVAVGDRLSAGDTILMLQEAGVAPEVPAVPDAPATAQASSKASGAEAAGAQHTQLLVLGSGPGGYSAAFRAADLGLAVTLVERHASLGGVCLNVGCIPSKALLHAAKVIDDAAAMADAGIRFGEPSIDLDRLRGWKDGIVGKLTGGLDGLARQRGVTVLHGRGEFRGPHTLALDDGTTVSFEQAIIAAGSEAVRIPGLPENDARVMTSTGALALADIPERLLVIGGGIIGLEMASVYHELGSAVTVVELQDRLMAGADADIVKPLLQRITDKYAAIHTATGVTAVEALPGALRVSFDGPDAPASAEFDRVLVAVGRRPNGHAIGAAAAGVSVSERGFIAVDAQQRTNVPHIFAIGDIVGEPMLAHKAVHEGKVAAEVAAGHKSALDTDLIPSVAYTDPEIAWVGLTESKARADGIDYGKGVFPWAASGRSLALGRSEGITKLLFDPASNRLLGAGIVGPNAGDLIAEVALAMELGADAEDIGLTIHPHPTLSETVAMAAEAYAGTITDLYVPKSSARAGA